MGARGPGKVWEWVHLKDCAYVLDWLCVCARDMCVCVCVCVGSCMSASSSDKSDPEI